MMMKSYVKKKFGIFVTPVTAVVIFNLNLDLAELDWISDFKAKQETEEKTKKVKVRC
jgi:hypothetical protein